MQNYTLSQEIINALPEDISIIGDFKTRKIFINGDVLTPKQSLRVCNHSPTGFNWGYGGSGPAQLALAILLKYLPLEDAVNLYQNFKFSTVASWPQADFEIRLNLKEAVSKISKSVNHQNAK